MPADLHFFLEQSGFDAAARNKITGFFAPKTYKSGDFFVQEGKTSRHLAFIEEGLFQYFVLVEGEEKTTYISDKGTFLASLSSFLRQEPARENIRCVTDAQVWLISRTDLAKLLKEVDGFATFYISLLEYQLVCVDNSRLDFIILSAQQRYDRMLHQEPELLQRIPLQYLASILGVTPRHLSRIRKKTVHPH